MPLMEAPSRRNNDDNLIPMINIVFLLLIFFMIAGQIQNSLPKDIHLPNGTTGKPANTARALLHITADGKLFIEGEQLALAELDDPRLLAKYDDWALVADKTVTAKRLDAVLRRIQNSDIERLTLLTQSVSAAP